MIVSSTTWTYLCERKLVSEVMPRQYESLAVFAGEKRGRFAFHFHATFVRPVAKLPCFVHVFGRALHLGDETCRRLVRSHALDGGHCSYH
jgi:hypothetical protein